MDIEVKKSLILDELSKDSAYKIFVFDDIQFCDKESSEFI